MKFWELHAFCVHLSPDIPSGSSLDPVYTQFYVLILSVKVFHYCCVCSARCLTCHWSMLDFPVTRPLKRWTLPLPRVPIISYGCDFYFPFPLPCWSCVWLELPRFWSVLSQLLWFQKYRCSTMSRKHCIFLVQAQSASSS